MRVTGAATSVVWRVHPPAVRGGGVRASLGWWLAAVTAALLLIDAATGALLLLHYHPTIESAYPDIQAMQARLSLGIVRDAHSWAASATLIAAGLLILRAILTASYRGARRIRWYVSVVMLALILLAAVSGAMLRADQSGLGLILAWLGGNMSARSAGRWLRGAYLAHAAIIPLVMVILAFFYCRRSRRADARSGAPVGAAEISSPEQR